MAILEGGLEWGGDDIREGDDARGCVCNVCKVDFTMYVLVGGKTVG